MSVYKAEYIWIDGNKPTATLRSKTKIVPMGEEPPVWGFDGSSTQQAEGHASDCVLQPVFSCPDPVRGGADKLVMCEVMLTDGSAHITERMAFSRFGNKADVVYDDLAPLADGSSLALTTARADRSSDDAAILVSSSCFTKHTAPPRAAQRRLLP